MNKNVSISSVLGKIFNELGRHKKTIFTLLCLSLISAGFDITVPIVIQHIIDKIIISLTNQNAISLWYFIFASAGILIPTISSRILKDIYDYKLFQEATRLEDYFRDKAYRKYLDLHTLYHHSVSSGQIIGRIDRGATGIYSIVNDIIGQNLFIPLIYVGVVFGILVVKNFWIAVIVFIPLPIYLALIQKLSRQIYEIDKKVIDQFENAAKEQYDAAGNVMTIKKFIQEEKEADSQKKMREIGRDIQYTAERLWNKMDVLQSIVSTLGRAALLIYAGYLIIHRSITVGELTLFMSLQSMIYAPMFQLSILLPRLRRNIARVEKLFSVIDESVEITDAKDATVFSHLEKNIIFSNVWFRYGENTPYAIKNINVVIPKGKVTALVGRSGSGKTTFVNLILRAYDTTQGNITFDGVNIKTVTQKSLRGQIAVVSQEIDLFSRSIRENISYGHSEANIKDIETAAKIALAHDFIIQLEKNYDTIVGERGVKLSGGQRQRIGIARAIFHNPQLLILDEATSHLDTVSERIVQKATDAVMRDRTAIVIAHRLSTVLKADQIIVFDHGNIETIGRHEELLKNSVIYKRLYDLQFSD